MEIEKIVEEQFGKVVQSGFIEEQIKKQLQDTLQSAISNSLRSYSDFGKEIESKIKEALGLGKLDFSLPEYNQLVCNWVKEMVQASVIKSGKEQIEKNLSEFFKPLEKTEWKISEIIEKFIEHLIDDGESGEIAFFCEDGRGDGYTDYYFDENNKTSKYSCTYKLRVNKKGVWAATTNENECSKMKTPFLYGFDSFMFLLFSTNANIINDSENVVTEYGNDYD